MESKQNQIDKTDQAKQASIATGTATGNDGSPAPDTNNKGWYYHDDSEYMEYTGATSLDELDAEEEVLRTEKRLSSLLTKFLAVVSNIVGDPFVPNKPEALRKAVDGLETRLSTIPKEKSFTVWKDADVYHWRGTFSNDTRDREGEILTSKSHDTFTRMIDMEIVDPPELWPWHTPLPVGKTDKVWTTVENGVTYIHAEGTGYPEYDSVFESWAKWDKEEDPLGMSHGMLVKFITRDPDDRRNINTYVSKEVSVLPLSRAANGDTSFHVIEEGNMSKELSKEKLEFLKGSGLDDEAIEALNKDQGSGEDIQEKEEETLQAQETQNDPQEETSDDDGSQEESAGETAESKENSKDDKVKADDPSLEKVAEAVTYAAEVIKSQSELIAAMGEQVTALESRLKDLEKTDTEKAKAMQEWTPLASLRSLTAHSVDSPESETKDDGGNPSKSAARVDGRTKLGKSGPTETDPGNGHPIGLIDALTSGKDWRGIFPGQ